MAAATAVVISQGNRQFQGAFSEMFFVSATLDSASTIDAAGETNTVAVPGVQLGDIVLGVSFGVDLVDLTVTAYVQAANAVEVRIQNESGATVDLASTTIKLVIARPAF